MITFANIVLLSAAAKILRAVLVRQVGGLGRRKYNGSEVLRLLVKDHRTIFLLTSSCKYVDVFLTVSRQVSAFLVWVFAQICKAVIPA